MDADDGAFRYEDVWEGRIYEDKYGMVVYDRADCAHYINAVMYRFIEENYSWEKIAKLFSLDIEDVRAAVAYSIEQQHS